MLGERDDRSVGTNCVRAVAVVSLLVVAGCAGLVGSGPSGKVEANVVSPGSPDAEPVPLSEVDDERLRNATKKAVSAYESNGTAEFVSVSVPDAKLDQTRKAYMRLPERPEEKTGRLVSYRGYTVRVLVLIYN